MKLFRLFAVLIVCSIVAVCFTAPVFADADVDAYYTERPLFNPYPGGGRRFSNFNVRNFGPVGIGITLKKPVFTMEINNVEEGSPAAATGQLKKGQIIESINGVVLKDRDPRMILGDIITEAEATDGVINLQIKDLGNVKVQIPVMGSYSKTWPLNCSKSDKIVRKLADYLATQETPTWGSALFMLSTGEDKDLAVVRKWLSGKEDIGPYPWHAGYLGIAYCEYYLRTGDENVLPAIEKMGVRLKETMYNGGWSGRGDGSSFTYSTGTGQMHAAGVHCITFLMLAKMCGVELDDYMFNESLKTFYRFAGHDNVPYGDGWPEGGFRDNGKSAGLAVALSAASRLTPNGEDSIYDEAAEHVGMKSFYATSWFHSAHTGGGIGEIWHNAAMSMLHDERPVQHRSFVDTRRWVMELSRRHDGTIGIAGFDDRYDRSASEQERSWGNYFALTYTIPRENLITFGAPKTKWCKSHQLPVRPWGRPADDAFVQIEPVENSGLLSMKDLYAEKVETDASLAVGTRVGQEDASDKLLLTNILHPEMGYRSGAMRSVVNNGRSKLVLPLLRASDPRVRHAGLLAITGMFKGRSLPNDQLDPEMFVLAGKMIEDPNEALWVVQAAMQALSRADKDTIAKHRDTLIGYMKHDDWFLQVRAMEALMPIATDPEHYKAILPLMCYTLSQTTTDQALAPVRSLSGQLGRANPEVKQFGMEVMQKAYVHVPDPMQWPGGRIMPDGAKTVKARFSSIFNNLPGGMEFVKSLPKMTTKAARTGSDGDMYVYSGTFTPNPDVVGTWHWAVWPRPQTADEVDTRATAWAQRTKYDSPKDVLQILDGGEVKGRNWGGYFWSGDMLIGATTGIARKMEVRTFGGKDFLIFENGGFEPGENLSTWNERYNIYMRVK